MTRFRRLLIGAFAIILMISSQQVIAMKCWRCSTFYKKACGEPFEPSKLHPLDSTECSWKCATLTYNNSEGIKSWSRFCAENQTELDKGCKVQDRISCDTCSTDRCNVAPQYGPITSMVAIPMAIASIFFLLSKSFF